ncbi:ROK family transcriptional regulator [Gardnerella sp. DNF00354]|jgi:xylose repressor|uniref:ROK family transcriptional regulator n=1 Tax=Gardnerella TaxID=2701 RepID=UPI000353B1A3|nr:ROK family transcriptional regulator [Gardnerella vaginalis]EPI56290.1 ROK family protein [Gardnerella vaginalis JCP7275]
MKDSDDSRNRLISFTPEDIRKKNRCNVLNLLYSNYILSRSDVAKLTGISKSSASAVVESLISDGLVKEGKTKSATCPGKPAVLLHLCENSRQIIVVDIAGENTIVGAITNLVGKVIERIQTPIRLDDKLSVDDIVSLIVDLRKKTTAPLLGIGISSPGVIDDEGKILSAPHLGWKNVTLADDLRKIFNVPVRVDNNANAAALGEKQLANGSSNLIYIQIARGVGAGTLISNKIVDGGKFTAGEIGHVVVDEDGLLCRCGKRGCLETLISIPRLQQRIADAPSEKDRIITQAGTSLGKILAIPIAMNGIEDVVVNGDSSIINDTFIANMQFAINSRIDSKLFGAVRVRFPALKQDASLLGESVAVMRSELC